MHSMLAEYFLPVKVVDMRPKQPLFSRGVPCGGGRCTLVVSSCKNVISYEARAELSAHDPQDLEG